jgi:hypothetical protein
MERQRSQWPKDTEAVNGRTEITMANRAEITMANRTEITMAKRCRSCKWKNRDHNDQKIQKL